MNEKYNCGHLVTEMVDETTSCRRHVVDKYRGPTTTAAGQGADLDDNSTSTNGLLLGSVPIEGGPEFLSELCLAVWVIQENRVRVVL